MKWMYLIVILIVGGVLAYYMFFAEKALPGTPMATAEAFMKAVLKDDIAQARSLCKSGAVSSLDPVIQTIKRINPDKLSINYKNMSTKPPLEGIMITFRGNMIPMQMVKEGDTWKIVNISIN